MAGPRRTIRAAALLLAAAVLLSGGGGGTADARVLSSTEDAEVTVVPNPHARPPSPSDDATSSSAYFGAAASGSSSGCDARSLLSPHRILRSPIATQPDTLIEIATRKVLSVPVPVYRFKQPARLSPSELPFDLILVSDVDVPRGGAGGGKGTPLLRELPVPPAMAADSWFPGYRWSPVVYSGCAGAGGGEEAVHVGWKFADSATGGFFYALIVEMRDEEEGAAAAVGVGALGEMIAEGFHVGTRAPMWMVDLLTRM